MKTVNGNVDYTRMDNGRWADNDGNVMGGGFSDQIGNNPAFQKTIRVNRKLRTMTDAQVLEAAARAPERERDPNDPHPDLQDLAKQEAIRRGLRVGKIDSRAGTAGGE